MNTRSFNNEIKKPFPILHKGMNKGYEYTNKVNPDLADLLKQIFILLMMPLLALRAKLYRIFLKPFKKLENKNIPIFRLAIIFIGFYLICQKNVSFSLNMSNATAMIAQSHKTDVYDIDEKEYNKDEAEVMKTNVSTPSTPSDYAPVSVKHLEELSPNEYIKRYKDVARVEMKKYGIPASITLAQGLVESRAGNSKLAVQNNNHFGIKCFSKKCEKGHCTNHFDDNHKDFFRKYNSVWESFRAHSQLLEKDRYKKLKTYGKDYKKWAKGLKKAGYATDKRYDKKLIATIQKYKLYQYDK